MGETTSFKRPGIFESTHFLHLAQIAFHAQQYERAGALCTELLKLSPNDPEALFLGGLSFYYIDQFEDAISFLKKLLQDVPDYPEVHYFLGKSYKFSGDLENAIQHLKKAMLFDPKNKKIPLCLFQLFKEIEQYNEAKSYLIRALTMSPLDKKLWNELGLLERRFGSQAEAEDVLNRLELLERGPFLRPEANAVYTLGEYLFLSGLMDKANALFQKIVMEEVDDSASLCYLGHIAFQRKNILRGFDLLIGSKKTILSPLTFIPSQSLKTWNGENLEGKKLLIHKGMSPLVEILTAHCYEGLIQEADEVVVGVSEELSALMEFSFPKIRFSLGSTELERPIVDYEISSFELLRLLRPEKSACNPIQSQLSANPVDIESWKAHLKNIGSGLKIGIDPGLKDTELSTCKCLDHFKHKPNLVDWLKIQPSGGQILIDLSQDLPPLHQLSKKPRDLFDLAALLSSLDLVITSNLELAHLCGALGKPVWTLGHGLDWFFYGEAQHPFYSSMQLFKKGYYEDWLVLMKQVNQELKKI